MTRKVRLRILKESIILELGNIIQKSRTTNIDPSPNILLKKDILFRILELLITESYSSFHKYEDLTYNIINNSVNLNDINI